VNSKSFNYFAFQSVAVPSGCKLSRPRGRRPLRFFLLVITAILCIQFPALAATAANLPDVEAGTLTNALEVCRLTRLPQNLLCAVRLEGIVLWASPAHDQIIFQAGKSDIQVEMDLRSRPLLEVGQRVKLEGRAIAGYGRLREVLVDNDGLHPPLEKSETIYLPAGRLPIQVAWFNGPAAFELKVDYARPGMPRQRIPDAALFRAERKEARGASSWVVGLEYRCYEGNWERLPDFRTLSAVKSGTSTNFDLGVRTQDLQVGLQFSGYLEVPEAGLYTFYLESDDGSRLHIGDASLQVSSAGRAPLPAPRTFTVGQKLEDCLWAEVEGVLTSVRSFPSGGMEAELSLGTNRMYMEVANGAGQVPGLFMPVRASGVCHTTSLGEGRGQASRLLVAGWEQVQALGDGPGLASWPVTQVAELLRLGHSGQRAVCRSHLEGLVLAADSAAGWLVLQDASGAALVNTDLRGQLLRAGQTVVLDGMGTVEGARVRLGYPALVDNDGIHSMVERSGTIFLNAGRHALHLSWFNRDGPSGLEVSYEGPGLPRQRVPAAALLHAEPEPESGAMRWVPGVTYCCYEGSWTRIPEPGLLLPVKEGIAAGFEIGLASRPASVGLEFSGLLEVPRDGLYTFWVNSDDGSRLSLGEILPKIEVTGSKRVPTAVRLAPRQLLREDQEAQWSQVEGTVTFASEQADGLALELSSASGQMRVEVADRTGSSPLLLLNSRIRVTGLPRITYTTDGQRVAGTLLAPSLKQIEFLEMAPRRWADFPVVSLRTLTGANSAETLETIVHVRGRLHAGAPGEPLVIADETGEVLFETGQPPPQPDGAEVEVLGRWARLGSNIVLRCGCYRTLASEPGAGSKSLPLLTTIEQVKSLSREEAERGYPIRIRGILTAPLVGGFFIQDSTWAIYVSWDEATNTTLYAGDYWEVEGKTFAEFAPNIEASRAERLGPGTLPEPLHPTWDQLINGSLDTRYVEVQGIVTKIDGDSVALLTRAGKITVQLPNAQTGALRHYENALIRVRGCIMPGRNANTQQVEVGRIRMLNSLVTVDEPAPANPFAATSKRAADLLLFDPRAGAIQRVKIAGQVVHARRGEYFLLEGASGLRFVPKAPVDLRPGDLAEVVGFPVLGGPSPVLVEAMARRTGHARLPPARALSEENLLNEQHEATLVRVKARLVNVSFNGSEQVLEVQAATRGFVARLDTRGVEPQALLPGSRLELTGVYAGQGGDAASGRGSDGFELLLNSAADIGVLERPSWWTLRHTLTVVGSMVLVLLAAMVWITQLRRQVEERSSQLAAAVLRQEHAEGQRALEEERARVARDLHDDLGAALTEIGLLGGLAQRVSAVPDRVRDHLAHITDRARGMVTALDEIVWSLNPKHDSLASLSKYFCEYAQQFVQPTSVRCRLEVPEELPDCPLTSEQRHHLLLGFKEALSNVVRHAEAAEVRIGIAVENDSLTITVADDGCGWDNASRLESGDGLNNLSCRLQQVGGNCQVVSQPGCGTRVRMILPILNPTAFGSGKI
jgi:signal transduction histidine kinase